MKPVGMPSARCVDCRAMTNAGLTHADAANVAATQERILDATESLLAEHGVAGTSVRMITDLAQVNVAAVNYHFGSKEKLIRAVIGRRIAVLEAARTAAFDALDARAAAEGRAPTPHEVAEVLIAPVFAQALSGEAGWTNFVRFVSRLVWEPGVEELAPPESSVRLFERLDAMLRRALPALGADDGKRLWRLAFLRGATQHTLLMITALRTGRLPRGLPIADAAAKVDPETIKNELIAFVAAGLSA